MMMKSLLLGAAAGIVAIGAAQAADLPMTKGEAVEYVKVCTAFGPGFFYIPGTDTCLKIGGEIRADYRAFGGTGFTRNDNRSAFNTEARIWFDARSQTDWGLLRSYFQIDADSHPISHQGRDTGNSSTFYNGNQFTIDKAFIQFGGLTAGYAHSFFGFYDNEYGDTIWGGYYVDYETVNEIAYTMQFGGGLNATLSIEDGRDHRVSNGFTLTTPGGSLIASNAIYGGQQVPDVVGQIRWDQDWGTLAAQGALHQYRSGIAVDDDGVPLAPTDDGYVPRKNKFGFAVGGDVLIKIPAIDGGHFVVEGQYADGALDYLGAGGTWLANSDYFVRNGGQVESGKGWSVTAELGGNITPQWGVNLVGAYIDTTYDNAFSNGTDFKLQEFTLTGNLTYTVVKGLTVAGEVVYTHGKLDNAVTNVGDSLNQDNYNVWQVGMRVKRTF